MNGRSRLAALRLNNKINEFVQKETVFIFYAGENNMY